MGYTTEFEGKLTITPPLSEELVTQITAFCEMRHGGPMDVDPGVPGFWCDWETNGDKLYWNGAEKSYNMVEWLTYLIEHFLKPNGHTVDGRLLAQGENRRDRWYLVAAGDKVYSEAVPVHYTE